MNPESSAYVEAVIPSNEQPPRVLITAETGALPIIEHEPEYGTYEGALHELARRATGISLGVDRGLGVSGPNTLRYRTKPISPDSTIDPRYTWSAPHTEIPQ